MKKIFLPLILLMLWSTKANAYDYAYNGLYFNVDVLTSTASLTNNGTGNYSGNIHIPEKFIGPKEIEYVVTSIGENAFYGCWNLNSVSIPNTVTNIGKYAFYGCSNLTTITLPNMVTEIGEGAFRECTKLSTMKLPPLLTIINSYLLYGCSSLTSVTIPSKVTEIKNHAFANCSKLPRVTLPQACLNIGESAFSYCSSLSDVTLSDVLKTIGGSAFSNCTSLSTITLPGSLESIGNSAFNNTTSLLNVTIPASVTTIGENAFSNSALQTLTYADGCSIALRTWATRMVVVILPKSIKEIANEAFSGCTLLPNISLPKKLNNIGYSAFYNCRSLTKLLLPASVSAIGNNAFSGSGITNLEYASGTNTALRTYATSLTTVTIPSTVKRFAPDLFYGCNQLENVYIFDIEMWNYIFSHLTSNPFPVAHKMFLNGNLLKALNADFGCDISNYAFCSCIGLEQVNITGSVTGIQDYAFMQCPDLAAVAMGSGVIRIGLNAFQGCTALTAARLGPNLKVIGKNAFYGCNSLNSLLMGGSEQTIGEGAFQGCSKLPVAKLPSSMMSIGASAFRDCYELQEVIIPAGITVIPDYAFYDCRKLNSLQIGEAVASIQSNAFNGCKSLTIVRIPNSTTTIGDYAFNNCDSLRYAYVGTGINTIGNRAFGSCKRLLGFYCEALDVQSCNSYAFDGSDTKFISLYVPDESISIYKSKSPWSGFNNGNNITGLASAPRFVNKITLSTPVLVLEEGDAAKIDATAIPEDATNKKVNWTSSNTDVVYVNNKGSVLANVEGIATIRVTAADGNGAAANCLIIISNNFKAVSKVSLSQSRITLSEGKEAYLTATTSPASATYGEVVWTSSNPLVAQVSNVGLVTALTAGSATITCSAADGKGAKATCLVNVTEPVDPTIGDANEDGKVSVADLVYVISVIKKRIEAGDDISLYDVNSDGVITSEDAMAISDIILHKDREPAVRLLELSTENVTLGIGDELRLNRMVIPYRWNDRLKWTSSDEKIVTVDGDGLIKALHAGSAYVTVRVNGSSAAQAQCLVTVDGSRGSTDGHIWVDLGLPSGTRWATTNIGASTPQEYGNYFAWGENNTKNNYDWYTYIYCDGSATALNKYCTAASQGVRDDKVLLETIDDAAISAWSDNWSLPTIEQFKELFNTTYTISIWTEQNGVYGRLVTSKMNGNTLFLPAAGYMNGNVHNSSGSGGYFATRNLSNSDCQYNYSFNIGSSQVKQSDTYRCYGQSVRPVCSSTIVVSPSSSMIEVGETLNLQVEYKTINGIESTNVIWTSSNKDIATVSNNGVVKALSNGVAYIYATAENGIVGYCKIKVGVFKLPEGYTKVEYIQAPKEWYSTSQVWTVPNDLQENYNYIFEFTPLSWENSYYGLMIGGNNEGTVFPRCGIFKLDNGWGGMEKRFISTFWNYNLETRSQSPGGNYRVYTGVRSKFQLHCKNYDSSQGAEIVVDNEGYTTYTHTSTSIYRSGYSVQTGIYDIPLFTTIDGNTAYTALMQLHNFKVEDKNGKAIYDYIPCIRNSDSKVGLYDIVNGAFYYPSAFTLTAGPEVRIASDVPQIANAIDLGLSIKWASWNIGASKVGDYGGLYGAGDPTGLKTSTNASDYYFKNGESICGTEYDLAHVIWGGNWRMPTFYELNELKEKCTWEEKIMIDGVLGSRATGPNGNSIFIPYAGSRNAEGLHDKDYRASLFSGDMGTTKYESGYKDLDILSTGNFQMDGCPNWVGQSIRPVYVEKNNGEWREVTKSFDKSIAFKKIRVKNTKTSSAAYCCVFFSTKPSDNTTSDTKYNINFYRLTIGDGVEQDDYKGYIYINTCKSIGENWYEYEFKQPIYFSHYQSNTPQKQLQAYIENFGY